MLKEGNLLFLIIFITLFIVLLWLFALTASYRKEARKRREITRKAEKEDAFEIILQNNRDIKSLKKELAQLSEAHQKTKDVLKKTLQRVGFVRFNAFDDLGGELSFAIALLDKDGNGLVLSSIYGREENRIYAKPVTGGRSNFNLSEEEKKAIAQAMEAKLW